MSVQVTATGLALLSENAEKRGKREREEGVKTKFAACRLASNRGRRFCCRQEAAARRDGARGNPTSPDPVSVHETPTSINSHGPQVHNITTTNLAEPLSHYTIIITNTVLFLML